MKDQNFDLELLGGTPTNDASEIIELRSAGIAVVGFELDAPLESDKAFLLKIDKKSKADI